MSSITGQELGALNGLNIQPQMLSCPELCGGGGGWVEGLECRGCSSCVCVSDLELVLPEFTVLIFPSHPLWCSLWYQVIGLRGGRCVTHPGLWRDHPVLSQPEESLEQGSCPCPLYLVRGPGGRVPFLLTSASDCCLGLGMSVCEWVNEREIRFHTSEV